MPADDKHTIDFYLHRNNDDIQQLHIKANQRYQKLKLEIDQFREESNTLSNTRKVDLFDDLTAKYNHLSKTQKLKEETRTGLSPDVIRKVGKGYLGSNQFLRLNEPYNVLNY